jgi:hypothetical protein
MRGRTHRTQSTMFVIVDWPLDSPSKLLEPIEHRELKENVDAEDDVFRFFRIPLSREEEMVEEMSEHQNGEIQSWKLSGGMKSIR